MGATGTLKARRRDGSGKGSNRKLRATGEIPAVLYGHGDRTESLSLNAHELDLLLHSIRTPGSAIIHLDIDGGATDALIREIQRHPVKPEILHVDFLVVHAGEPVKVEVPVVVAGTPVGVHTDGGVLDQVLYTIEVEALPRDLPETLEVDVSGLGVGESARVRDLRLPRGVRVTADAELPVASVLAPRVEEEAPAEAPEPEVLRERRGEDEE
ncbi:MAG TPA: 50S ribosomal protein L25 [Longimicrobium sp.]|nr:50S ribosomal protein L25 [Longimicrobium sp.]